MHTREDHKYISLKGFRFRKLEGNALLFPYVGLVNISLNETFIHGRRQRQSVALQIK